MDLKIRRGRIGLMENMNYDFELDDNVNVESLKILINQCWKLLPIYE